MNLILRLKVALEYKQRIEISMAEKLENIQVIADFVCHQAIIAGENISVLKLHKLLYYVEAWHLAIFKREFFSDNFEAWVHGPVNTSVFKRYVETKSMYSPILQSDLKYVEQFDSINPQAAQHIENVMAAYMPLSGPQLENLTHMEDPWIQARGTCKPYEKCTNTIDKNIMMEFYAKKLVQ